MKEINLARRKGREERNDFYKSKELSTNYTYKKLNFFLFACIYSYNAIFPLLQL